MAIFPGTRRNTAKVTTAPILPAAKKAPAEDTLAAAERIALAARSRADQHAEARGRIEARIGLLGRGLAALKSELAHLEDVVEVCRCRVAEIESLSDILGVPEADDAGEQRQRLAAADARLTELRPQVQTVTVEIERLEVECDELQRRERQERASADRALTTALAQERAALLDEISEARLRYLWAVRQAGKWNRRHQLLDRTPHRPLLVQPILAPDPMVTYGIPHVGGVLDMTVEVAHVHRLLDDDFRRLGLLED